MKGIKSNLLKGTFMLSLFLIAGASVFHLYALIHVVGMQDHL
jgi:hypothetical protein